MLQLRERDPARYRHALLDACLTNDVYDASVDGTFARYLADLVNATGDRPWFVERIIAAVGNIESGDDYWRVIEVLAALALDGDAAAERAIRVEVSEAKDLDVITLSSDALIELDGLEGVVEIARRIGELAASDAEIEKTEPSIFDGEQRFGKPAVEQALEAAAQASEGVGRFLRVWRELQNAHRAAAARRERSQVSFERLKQVMDGIAPNEFMSPFRWIRWSEQATDDEIRWVADRLAEMDDSPERRLLVALEIFHHRRYPLDHRVLMRFLDSPHSRVSWFAYSALEPVGHPEVRALAFRLMQHEAAEHRARAVDMLLSNYHAGDDRAVEALIAGETDDWALHSIGLSVFNLVEKHADPALHGTLAQVYERDPCAMCRETAVSLLIARDAFTAEMARECLWDANLDTRELARTRLSGDQ